MISDPISYQLQGITL